MTVISAETLCLISAFALVACLLPYFLQIDFFEMCILAHLDQHLLIWGKFSFGRKKH